MYGLRCETCDVWLANLVATTPEELLTPDYNQVMDQTEINTGIRLREFLTRHEGHNLSTVKVPRR